MPQAKAPGTKKLPEFPRARSIGGVDDSPISHGSDTEWFHTYLHLFIDDGTVKVVPNEDHMITVPLMTDLNGEPRKWREIAPFTWRDVNGEALLSAEVADGRVVRFKLPAARLRRELLSSR